MEPDEEYDPDEILGMHEFLCYKVWEKSLEKEIIPQLIPLI